MASENKQNLAFIKVSSSHLSARNILLIHGLTSSKETWATVQIALSSIGSVWAIDLPGYGESFEWDYKDFEAIGNRIKSFIDYHQLNNLTVIGHSMGAKLAVVLSNKLNPQKLIIEDMEMEPRNLSRYNPEHKFFQEGVDTQEILLKLLAKFDYYPETIKGLLDKNYIICTNNKYFSRINPEVDWWYQKNVTSDKNILEKWAKMPVTIDTMLLRATEKSSVTDMGTANMLKTRRNLLVRKISDSGHSIHRSKPDEFIRLVKEFLQ